MNWKGHEGLIETVKENKRKEQTDCKQRNDTNVTTKSNI